MFRYICALLLILNPLAATAHDLKHLPLGDNLKSSAPMKNHLWPCRIEPEAGGAIKDGPWINAAEGTFDKTAKISVDGNVKWPHSFKIELQAGARVFTSNDLPEHGTGTFPIESRTAAYAYDTNPNSIKSQTITFSLPANPQLAAQAGCAPGAVGILLSGVALFSAIDAPGRDAVAHEVQDTCEGHPQPSGIYHYHDVSICVKDTRNADGSSGLVGYAIDGFGIYGSYIAGGKKLDSKDLDECHGMTSEVMWDGKLVNMYHYVATSDFPYSVGCLRGTFDPKTARLLSGPPPSWF